VLRDSGDLSGFSRELWHRFADMGFNGVLVHESLGGLALGHVEAGIILEQIGRNLTPSPFLSTAVGAVTALKAASPTNIARWVAGIVRGETVAALAIDETPRHQPAHISLRAERVDGGFRLTGHKCFVLNGHAADLLIVAARTAAYADSTHGLSLFAVPAHAAGLGHNFERLADASLASRMSFDGVAVDADALIGELGGGSEVLRQVLAAVRTGASAELLGVGTAALDMTVSYLKTRRQFDRPIGAFQALQHRAAHLYAELEVARAAILKAQILLDAGDPAWEHAVPVAKAMTGMAVSLAVQEGVQLHGGVGMTDEYDIGLYMKGARVLQEIFGDADFHAGQLARLTGY
jgi:alkylation response protein AidB-like acyl-CoA dehydrogenase